MEQRTAIKTLIGSLRPVDAAAAVEVASGEVMTVELESVEVGVESMPSLLKI